MNPKNDKVKNKLRLQGILTEVIDENDNELSFHHFSPIQETYGYPEVTQLEENK